MSTSRLPSKEAREMHALVTSLGYELDRWQGGHLYYTHADQDPLTLSSTPSDFRTRANDLARLKRRHPEAFEQRKNPEARRRRSRKRRAVKVPVSLVGAEPLDSARVPAEFLQVPACRECGRPWLSDLDYSCRACPECGGPITCQKEAA